MAKRKNPSRVNIPMCAAGVLLCLTLFSAHFTSGLYAKYTATATGSDSARVAKFEVVTTNDTDANVTVTTGQITDNIYQFTIENHSEVAVRYTLSVTNLTSFGITADFDGDSDSGQLAISGDESKNTRTLTFSVDDWAKFTADDTGDQDDAPDVLTKEYEFVVNVHIEQID